ncbi:hypothetical protein [Pontibacillus litoralis]|uniref:Uncharacterized protein n=1 Tax=Pontibacillus litoralis JSM 072002 TaxID=1385512 RepID=A0A0A5FWN7_9BACI|nr:hypothetical protein [Pontibacillus litoralis]KGX85206.1 hypothetical protein N784_09930 [Pontibacillus litoralis JSM 072002]
MAENTQSKILSIEEQIKKLKEKQKREIAKLERNTGKRFLDKFNLQNESLDTIYEFIDTLIENQNNNTNTPSGDKIDESN